MRNTVEKDLPFFYMAGINYVKTNTQIRSLFAFDSTKYQSVAQKLTKLPIPECYILSTCNRTEIYGFAKDAKELISLLCEETEGDAATFEQQAYILNGASAIKHLYQVTCGLNSQILGDFEITSQIKQALKRSKETRIMGTFIERLLNSVLQASKKVKSNTNISSGTVSAAFAAIQHLKKVDDIRNKKILLYGLGKIGQNTCKNLISYLGCKNITLVNRTEGKAREFAKELRLNYVPESSLKEELQETDVLLVATNAPHPTLNKEDISERNKIIIDLSIPCNIAGDVKDLPEIQTIDIDQLSQIQDNTLKERKKEIPKVNAIIEEHQKDFMAWYQNQKNVAILKAMKDKMEGIYKKEIDYYHKKTQADMEDLETLSSRMIQKTVDVFAVKLKNTNGKGKHYRDVLEDIFEMPMNKENGKTD